MNRMIQRLLLLSLIVGISYAGDLRVNIINGTTGKPGQAELVALLDLTSGMVPVASAEDVTKSTTFSDVSSGTQSQYLIRATSGGATYSAMFVPTVGVSAWETSITVYESSETVQGVNASVPFFVIYGFKDKLYIQKRFNLDNISNPPMTFTGNPGVIKVHVPDNVTEIESFTYKSGTMPIATQAIKTDQGQVIPNPLKPGITDIDISYYVPYDPAGTSLSEVVGYDIEHFHVYTMPISLNLTAPGLSREGTDNENGLAIYAIETVKAGKTLNFQVSGEGMAENGEDEHAHDEQPSGRIVIENRLDSNTELLIAAILVMSVLIALFVSVTQQNDDLKQDSIQMLKDQKSDLLKQYAALDQAADDSSESDKILYRLVSVYKTLDRIK